VSVPDLANPPQEPIFSCLTATIPVKPEESHPSELYSEKIVVNS
jgi:hypothetical protein